MIDIEAIERRAATLHLGEVTNGDGVPDPDSGFITWTDAQGVDMGWVELSGQGAAVLAEQIVSRFAAHKDLSAEVATLRAALTAAEGARDRALAGLQQIQQLGAPFDPKGTHADRVRAIAVAAQRPAATQAKEIADDQG